MTETAKRLALSFLLIIIAAGVLLWSDRHNRHSQARHQVADNSVIPVAILQHSSTPMMDDIRMGILQGLKASGFNDGQQIAIQIYNAEGDLPTGNLMAQKMTSGDYRLGISISTVMLQALANTNRDGKVTHVFGGVTSPVAAGVGIKAIGSLDKPAHLTGIGTPQPVHEIFRLAKQLNPALKTVGVVWNPVEVNSEICTQKAREISKELGITLLEAPIEHAKDVREAAHSLVARGVEAFWTGGDATVNTAIDSLMEVAHSAKMPVFSNISGHARRGGLFDLGANYFEVGVKIGDIAAQTLAGTPAAKIAVEDYVPQRIILNDKIRTTLKDTWIFNDDLRANADIVIGEDSTEKKRAVQQAEKLPLIAPQANRLYKIGVAYFAPEPGIDSVMSGLREGLAALGWKEGKNLSFQMLHAQAEIAQIPTMGQVLDNSDADAILTLTTPVLQGVGMQVKRKPAVFTYVTDPLAAGAGKNFNDHLPNVTGIGSFPPLDEQLALIREVFPKLQRLGTLYNPSEANSVKVVEVLRQLCAKANIKLEEAPINTTAEVVQASQALVSRKIDAIISVGDNTMYQALDAIAKIAKDAAVPLILDQPDFIDHEALMVVGVDYKESGRAAAQPLAQVLSGRKPADIPFQNVSKKTILLNDKVAQRLGVVFPESVRAQASATTAVLPVAKPAITHTWKIKRVLYVESPPAEEALRGIEASFKASGLVEGKDFVMTTASAQGDMITLSSLADKVNSDGTDLLMTLSTPTLQAALNKVKKIPIVFTFVANPVVAGAGKSDTEHLPLVTGTYTLAPFAEMVALLKQHFPNIKHVGTLFTPAEDNSVHNKDVFVKAAAQQGIQVTTLPINSAGELADAALAMANKPIDAWVQTLDNQVLSGFTLIAQAATRAKKPLFTFTESAVKQGAAMAVCLDYYQAGFDAADKAIAIMRGNSPADIPFSRPSKISLVVSESHAKALGVVLPIELINKADKRF